MVAVIKKTFEFLTENIHIYILTPSYDGLEFPNIATRICAINRTNAKMVIKFYVVSMYRNLNIDIMNVAKVLPTEERFSTD